MAMEFHNNEREERGSNSERKLRFNASHNSNFFEEMAFFFIGLLNTKQI